MDTISGHVFQGSESEIFKQMQEVGLLWNDNEFIEEGPPINQSSTLKEKEA